MKKTISLLLVAVLLVAVMAPTAFAAEAGETVTVALYASGDDFANFQGALTYDHTKLTLVSITGSNCNSFLGGTNNPDNFVWSRNDNVSSRTCVMIATFTLNVAIPCGDPINVGASISWCGNQDGEAASISVSGSTNYHVEGETKTEDHIKGDCVTDSCVDTVVYCSLCGEEMSRTHSTTAAPGHVAGDVVIENKTGDTCTAAGSYDEVVYCTVCGEELSRNTVTGSALGHDWVDATCTTPKTCKVCGETEGEALGHDWNEATCTTPKTCSVCGETEGEALGHKYVCVPNAGKHTHNWVCSVCEAVGVENEACTDSNKDGKCDDCGQDMPKDKPTEPTDPEGGNKTGDVTPYPVFFMMAIAAVMGTAYGFKRKFVK